MPFNVQTILVVVDNDYILQLFPVLRTHMVTLHPESCEEFE